MSRFVRAVIVVTAAGVALPTLAQQANDNVSVLPVVVDPADPDAHLKGDLYLQRQVEPALAASTRNPEHLLAFFNDYRAVDVPDDPGLGTTLNVARAYDTARTVAAFLGLQLPRLPLPLPETVAAAEAWVGMSRSYDGGLTWSGALLPGAPFDTSPASLAAPVHGLEAATDPVLAPAPCGMFYLGFVAFTRGGESMMTVARYEDRNDSESGDTIVYRGMTVVESGNNATNGYFLDKPHLAVDVRRGASADPCGHSVYVSYTTFNGLDKDGKFQSKINFARSFDGGVTFEKSKLNMPYSQSQGTVVAVDPRPGTPDTTGGGTVYIVWRHFFDPDAMVMTRSSDFGVKFSKPVEVTGAVPMAPFDQPTLATTAVADPVRDIAFRSNGFPTATVSSTGALFVAWQERVDIDPGSSGFGRPAAGGSPRIVVARSTDRGDTWTDVDGVAGQRRAVDLGDRDAPGNPARPAPGFGALPQSRPSGPQVMPRLSFGGGRLLLAYYESRGLLGTDPVTGGETVQVTDLSPTTGFISGIDRVTDFRAALLDPATGALLSTTQVSRYPIAAAANLADGETVGDVAPINPPCSPDHGPGLPPCVRQLNRTNIPQSGSGSSPFMGDYPDAAPVVQFVPTADGSGWRWATAATDVPYRAFRTAFADNRHLVPASEPAELPEWARYQFYGPPGVGGACVNAGSRNSDIITARVDAELVVRAPTTYKQLDARRGFPVSVTNAVGETRFYRLRITTGAGAASFSRTTDVDQGDVEIFPYSSVSQVVYIEAGTSGPIRVEIEQIDGRGGDPVPDGQSGAVTFNGDPSNPAVVALDPLETQDPFVVNPFVVNPFVVNPFVVNSGTTNLSPTNPFVVNPFVVNPFVVNSTIYDVVDTTWEVEPGGNTTASSYLPLINVDNAAQFVGDYAFQLIVYKASSYGALDACSSYAASQAQILSNVVQDPSDTTANPFVVNPFVVNPFVVNPFVVNPFVVNSTFTMAPADSTTTAQTATLTASAAEAPADDGTLKAPRAPDHVFVTLRAFQLSQSPTFVFDPTQDPPSLAIVPLPCDPDHPSPDCRIAANGPDLVPVDVDPSPLTVEAGTPTDFPEGGWTLVNQGNTRALAENRPLEHGIVLSADDVVDFAPDGSLVNGDLLLGSIPSASNELAAGAQETFTAASVTIPESVPAGPYRLILYADVLREVSEVDEVNNAVAVAVDVQPPNHAPVAYDAAFSTAEDTPFSATLTADDADGDALTFTIVDGPGLGSVELTDTAAGTFVYTPDAEVSGTDTFTFRVDDGRLQSNVATATVTVAPVNDAPVAFPDTLTVAENAAPTAIDVLANDTDTDGDPLAVTAVGAAAHGTVALGPPVTYAPATNFVGTDAFAYTVSDGNGGTATGTVSVSVVDTVPDWGFLGLQSPWTADPVYTANTGSSIPLIWQYTDPATGAAIDTVGALPEVHVTGPFECTDGADAGTLEVVLDPGSSGYQYDPRTFTHQFNWQTKNAGAGCYDVRVVSLFTRQVDGPFRIRLQ